MKAQLGIFIRGIKDQFEVTEELLSLCPIQTKKDRNTFDEDKWTKLDQKIGSAYQ